MKKFVVLVLVVIFVLSAITLAGCGTSSFSIDGGWINKSDTAIGQIRGEGDMINFNNGSVSFISPFDTYTYDKDTKTLYLKVAMGDTWEWNVDIKNNDSISISHGSKTLDLERVK